MHHRERNHVAQIARQNEWVADDLPDHVRPGCYTLQLDLIGSSYIISINPSPLKRA